MGNLTLRACTVHGRVIPREVRAPYQRQTDDGRQVKSQRERDDAAKALEARRQRLADELGALADDKRLTSEARGTLKWYRAEVDQAKTMARLNELVDQFRDERLRRTGWFSRPAVAEIEPPDYDDEDQGDDADWEEADWSEDTPLAIAAPGRPPSGLAWTLPGPAGAMTWAGALARLGWRIVPSATGCQVSEGAAACNAWANRHAGGGRMCHDHYQGLASAIMRSS